MVLLQKKILATFQYFFKPHLFSEDVLGTQYTYLWSKLDFHAVSKDLFAFETIVKEDGKRCQEEKLSKANFAIFQDFKNPWILKEMRWRCPLSLPYYRMSKAKKPIISDMPTFVSLV